MRRRERPLESHPARDLGDAQRRHWQRTYTASPEMYGPGPSAPAVCAAGRFRASGATTVLELGAGHGRDTLYFAEQGFTVIAGDFSSVALRQLRGAAGRRSLERRILATVHDVREPLPLAAASVDAAYGHMLLSMALTTDEIQRAVGEVGRVLRPGGTFVYTVRTTGDAHYGTGVGHGDDIWEQAGFAVHFFSRHLVDTLAAGWTLEDVAPFEEGALPRRLWRVTQTRPA
ncbi:MAG: class I SAM-dependent methyltransferase [Candidatus Dormibacteraeota bacterium]|nr:class I SAM-dependent methyltransferase [Candidatus Dormibacteraeota bacterium]